jgi:poly(A) polymerase
MPDPSAAPSCRIIPRPEHTLSRSRIDPHTLHVLYRLQGAGHRAYLVGGGVRDLLLDRTPKDFDVATDAHPRQVRRLFSNSFLIGRRFRLVHVRSGEKITEVATFRRKPEDEASQATPRRPGHSPTHSPHTSGDNTFGTPEEDALRRDFTVNALFYNIADFTVIDYAGGMTDLRDRIIRMIGDPAVRIEEDPIRMLRAARLSARLGFSIDPHLAEAIRRGAFMLAWCSLSRLSEEFFRLLEQASAEATMRRVHRLGLLEPILPHLGPVFHEPTFRYLAEADRLQQTSGPCSRALLLTLLLAPSIDRRVARENGPSSSSPDDLYAEVHRLLDEWTNGLPIPRLAKIRAAQMLSVQRRIAAGPQKKPHALRLLRQPFFEEALKLFEVHCLATGRPSEPLSRWRELMAEAPTAPLPSPRRRRRRRRRR